MFKMILFGLLGVVVLAAVVVLVLASRKPDEFRVTRSILIAAPPEAIFPHIEDLQAWQAWSAYEDKDPDMRRTLGSPSRGVGATYAWDGDSNVGAGRMTVVEATAPSHVRIALDFTRPMQAHNLADFELRPEAGGTRVTWTMHGPALLVTKVMQVLMDMDEMVGRDFAAGLAKLKTRVETDAARH